MYIREDLVSPNDAIRNHSLISNDVDLAPKYITTLDKSILHFEDTFRMLRTESLKACHMTWHALNHSLQIIEYHSHERLRNALDRTPSYKRIMQRMKIRWIGCILNPPLLLGLQEGRYEAREKKDWR